MSAGGRTLARAKPVTADELAKLQRLHHEGLSCRQIAKELGRAPITVSRHARQLGLSFDRSQTIVATAARVADSAAVRAEVSAEFLAITQRINAKVLALLDDPEAEVKPWGLRDYAMAAGMFFDRHLHQDEHDAQRDTGGSAVDQWLAHMMGEAPPASESDHDETAKAKTLLGGLFDSMTNAYGDGQGDEPG